MANLTNEELRERLFEIGYDVPISINREFYLKFLARKEKELGLQASSPLINARIIPGAAGGDFHQEAMKEPKVVDGADVPVRRGHSEVADLDAAPVRMKEPKVMNTSFKKFRGRKIASPLPRWLQAEAASEPPERMDATAGEITDTELEFGGDTMKEDSTNSPHRFSSIDDMFTACQFWILEHPKISCFLVVVVSLVWILLNMLQPLQPAAEIVPIPRVISYSAIAIAFIYMGWRAYAQYQNSGAEQQAELFSLVEKVGDLLREQNRASLRSESVPPFLAINHIRDHLLTPQERTSKDKIALWNGVVDFVSVHESRILEEINDIDGVDFKTWRWLPNCNN